MTRKAPHAAPVKSVSTAWGLISFLGRICWFGRLCSLSSWKLKGGEIIWERGCYSGFHVQVPAEVCAGCKLLQPAFPRQQSISAHAQFYSSDWYCWLWGLQRCSSTVVIQTGALSKNLLHLCELKGVRGRNPLALDDNEQHQRLHLKFQGKGNYQPWRVFKFFSNSQPGHAQPHQTVPGSVCSEFLVIWDVPYPGSQKVALPSILHFLSILYSSSASFPCWKW